MKITLSFLFSLMTAAALAHESLVPHIHPHGVSSLPDLGTFIVGGIFMIATALLTYTKFGPKR